VNQELLDLLVKLALLDKQDLLEKLVLQVKQDLQDKLDQLVKQDLQEKLGKLGKLDLLVIQVLLERLVLLEEVCPLLKIME
jgi:hypothetical protein